MLLTRTIAEQALEYAHEQNPGPWADHARYVAQACEHIAKRCPHLDNDDAYICSKWALISRTAFHRWASTGWVP